MSVVDRAPGIRPLHVMAFVGRLIEDRFEVAGVTQLGMGPDFYAPATAVLPDGRWLLFEWVPEDPPGPESDRTWAGSLTFPRIVSVAGDGAIALALAAEVEALRGRVALETQIELEPNTTPWTASTPDRPFEVEFEIGPGDESEVVIELRDLDPAEPIARIAYSADRRLSVARRGIVSVAGRSSMSAATIPAADGSTVRLRAILDGSILELETNGHMMATLRLPGGAVPARTMTIGAVGGRARIGSLKVWLLEAPGG